MLGKATITLVAAAALFAAASAVQAASKNDGDSAGAVSGPFGYRIGPLGQREGGRMAWRGRPRSIYAYVPRARLYRRWYYRR
jgi:hypothetical protein